jgi:hypothetical protein
MVWGDWGKLNMVPIFCASCGKLGAYVPEGNMTFAFWLCDHPCADRWSPLPGTYTTPDEIFWNKVKEESMEQVGHYLTEKEVLEVEGSSCNPLSTLLKESPITKRR